MLNLMSKISVVLLCSTLVACGTMSGGSAPVADRNRGNTPEIPKPGAKPNTGAESGYTLKRGGGYYKDDGPGDNPPANIGEIPNAEPKAEPFHRFANRPYTVLGRNYTPLKEAGHYKARGLASWYGKKFHGQKTSTGETYDMYAMTAAHPTLPIPSYARVTNLRNGISVVVRVNDRGPFHSGRIIDLSYTAASKLGYIGSGSSMVEVESLLPGQQLPDTSATLVASNGEDFTPPDESPAANVAEVNPLPEVDDARGAWLQLGAFASRDNADALKSRLMAELRDLDNMGSKLVVRPSGNLFRVQLGPWADAREARGVADKVADILQIKPVLMHQ
jgi:rare lipoprotein A